MFSVIMLRVYGNFFQTLNYKTNQSDVKKNWFLRMFVCRPISNGKHGLHYCGMQTKL